MRSRFFIFIFGLMFLFSLVNVSAVFVGNGSIHSDGCYNYTANTDFNVTSLNYSSCDFQVDGVGYCEWENRSFFDTGRVCFDFVNVTDENNLSVASVNVSGDSSVFGDIARGTNATFEVNLTNQTEIDSVWIKIWKGIIGGPVLFFGWLENIVDNIWSIDVPINSTFNESEYNYTIYANTTGGVESNVSSVFNVSGDVSPGGVDLNMVLWLKADIGVNHSGDGTDVVSWEDQGVLGVTAGSEKPVYRADAINGNPGVDWESGDRVFTIDDKSTTFLGSMFYVVGKLRDGSSTAWLLGDAGNEFVLGVAAGKIVAYDGNSRASDLDWSGGEVGLVQGILPTGTNAPVVFSKNGGVGSETSSNVSFTTESYDGFGNNMDNPIQPFGTVSEIIVYDSNSQSAVEQQRIESYLGIKYGITLDNSSGGSAGDYLDSDGVIIWDANSNVVYHNDVAGVGRDDGSALNQVASRSESSDGIVTISNASGLDDGEFLVWGNNNGSASFDSEGVLGRVWFAEETGDVGEVSVSFEMDNSNFNVESSSGGYVLVVDNDTNFTFGAVKYPMIGNGSVYSVQGVVVADGNYFTVLEGSVCGDVSSSIVLNNDVYSDDSCFSVTADDVVLDCEGKTIYYANVSSGVGVNVTGRNNVSIRNCVVDAINETGSNAVYFKDSTNVSLINNTIKEVDVWHYSDNSVVDLTDASFENDFGKLKIFNTNSYGVPTTISVTNDDLYVKNRTNESSYAYMNSSKLALLNTTTEVTIYDSLGPVLRVDVNDSGNYTDCPENQCVLVSDDRANKITVFNVTHWTGYSTFESYSLKIWDQRDHGESFSNLSKGVNETINFYAEYIGGNVETCEIKFNDTSWISMQNNGTYFVYNRSFVDYGIYSWAVNCSGISPTLYAEDEIVLADFDVVLNSSGGGNTTAENLTVYSSNIVPSDFNESNVIYDWRVDGDSIAVVNLAMEGGSNGTWSKDYSTFGNNATVSGANYTSNGSYENRGGYEFNGSGDYMYVPYSDSLKVQGHTVATWVNTKDMDSSGNLQWVMGYPYNCTAHIDDGGIGFMQYGIWLRDDGNIHARVNGTFLGFYGANISADTWHHLAISYDLEKIRFYIDGELIGTDSGFSGPISYPGNCNLVIGKNVGDGEYFNGTIDSVQVYSRSLSDAQIERLYSNEAVMVKDEIAFNESWEVMANLNHRESQDVVSILTNDLTVLAESNNPSVIAYDFGNVSSKYLEKVIRANVTDESGFSVLANVTLPNGTVEQISLEGSGDIYSKSYSFSNLFGEYSVRFIATDSSGNVNSSEGFSFYYGYNLDSVVISNVDSKVGNAENLTSVLSNLSVGSGKVIYDWRENGSSIAVVNMPMDSSVSFKDDFDDNLIDDEWVVEEGIGSINEENSALNFSCSGSCDFWVENERAPKALVSVNGLENFTATVRLENYSVPDATHVGLVIFDDENNFYMWGRLRDGSTERYTIAGGVNGTGDGNIAFADVATLPAWFRIRAEGDMKYYEYSTNGSDFVSFYNDSNFDGKYVGVFAKSWRGEAVSIAFDNFSLTSPINDYSDYGNDGVISPTGYNFSRIPLHNVTGGYDGKGAFEFDGVDDSINLGNDSSLNFGTGSFSVSAWIKPDDLGSTHRIVDKYGSSGSGYSLFTGSSQDLRFFIDDGTNEIRADSPASNLSVGNWHHVVGVWDSSNDNIIVYVNGVEVGRNSVGTPSSVGDVSSLDSLMIGNGGDSPFDGSIDDVFVFNRSLSSEQIQLLYQGRNDLISSGETSIGENWSLEVTPNDGGRDGVSILSNSVSIVGIEIDSVLLNSSSGGNTTGENLTAWPNGVVPPTSRVVYDWRENGSSIAMVNMPMDGGALSDSNTKVKDYSTYSRHGTLGNGSAGTEPVYHSTGGYDGRGAYHFNGVNQSLYLGNWNMSGDQMSVGAWVKPEFIADSLIIGQSISSSHVDPYSSWNLFLTFSGGLHSRIDDFYVTTNEVVFAKDEWAHVFSTYDGEYIRLYVNGELKVKGEKSGNILNSSQQVVVGGRDTPVSGNEEFFNGTVDEVLVYDRVLSGDQIKMIYENRSDLILKDLLSVNDTWEVNATINDNFEDGNSVTSNNLTVLAESNNPLVFNVTPVSGSNFSSVDAVVEIGANVTDESGFSVLANITLPDGNVSEVSLSLVEGNYYAVDYVMPFVLGDYAVRFIARDASGNVNSSEVVLFSYGSDVLSVVLNSSLAGNLTSENLTVYAETKNLGNGSVVYDWRINGDSMAVLNMPFDREEGFVDDFSDGVVDEHWVLDKGAGNIVEGNGLLNISCDGACDWGDFTYYAPYAVVRTGEYGNFSAVVKVENYSFVDDSMGGLMLYDSDGNSSLFGRFRDGGINSYRVEEYLDNVANGVVENASISTLPAWFRIRKIGDVNYFDYSTDGSNFVSLHNTTNIRGDFVGVFVKRFGAENASVSFSDFKINSLSVEDYSSYGNDGVIEAAESGDSVPVYNSSGGYNGKGAFEFDGVDDSIGVDYVNLTGKTVSMRVHNGTRWYHLVNSSAVGYVNGEVSNVSLPFNGTRIGVYSDGSYFNGSIDEVVVFDRVLSEEQVRVLYENRTDLIVWQETLSEENWSVMVTANDKGIDSAGVLSGNLTILEGGCPSTPQNWEVLMSDYLWVNELCNLTGYNITFSGVGNFTVNATVLVDGLNNLSSGMTVWVRPNATIFMGVE